MRISARPRIGAQIAVVILWLALGTGAWLLFVDRARRERMILYPVVLAAAALVLFVLAWLRRRGLANRIEEFEVRTSGNMPAAGNPLAFTVRIASRGLVPVRLVAATLSAVAEPASPSELPAVIAREETVLAERVRVEGGKPLDFAGTLAVPQSEPSTRVQLDAVIYLGSRPARRTTVVLREGATSPRRR